MGATSLKETPDAAPAQASTHTRLRTAGRHRTARPTTRPHAGSPPQSRPAASSTRPKDSAYPLCQSPPPGTQGVSPTPAARPRRIIAPCMRHGPSTYDPRTCGVGPGNRGFCTWQPCARDSGNKTAASAHDMGSRGLAVDAMAIGCLGVERCGERFFVLSHFRLFVTVAAHISPQPRELGALQPALVAHGRRARRRSEQLLMHVLVLLLLLLLPMYCS